MSIDHFVSIIDRSAIDKVLSLSWKDFSRRYPWRKRSSQWSSARAFLEDFALDSPSDLPDVDNILDRRTLRWTMNRCSPRLFFMYEIIDHVPDLRARCQSYRHNNLEDQLIVHAACADAFVRGVISRGTLFAVLRFCERLALEDVIDLKKPYYDVLVQARKSWVPSMPPFRWLSLDYFGEGYACLNLRETRSVVRFLECAWKERWPAPLFSDWAREQLSIPAAVTPTVRDSEVAGQILHWFRSSKRSEMCLVSYVDPL
jgi:hypothetical protein